MNQRITSSATTRTEVVEHHQNTGSNQHITRRLIFPNPSMPDSNRPAHRQNEELLQLAARLKEELIAVATQNNRPNGQQTVDELVSSILEANDALVKENGDLVQQLSASLSMAQSLRDYLTGLLDQNDRLNSELEQQIKITQENTDIISTTLIWLKDKCNAITQYFGIDSNTSAPAANAAQSDASTPSLR